MFEVLPHTVQLAHRYLKTRLKPGATVVDATVGNGYDTLYLARQVAPGGKVYGFDVQTRAVEKATALIAEHGFSDMVRLFLAGHQYMGDYITEPIDAIVFNLGYLPGGDHDIVTCPETTVQAVAVGLSLLKPGGLMCIVVYTGHPGAEKEQCHLETYLQGIGKKQFCVGKLEYLNREKAPYLLVIEKSRSMSVVTGGNIG